MNPSLLVSTSSRRGLPTKINDVLAAAMHLMAILDHHCLGVGVPQARMDDGAGEDEKIAANSTKISRQISRESEGLL